MARKTTSRPRVRVAQLAHAKGLDLPAYQTAEAAGLDIVAAVPDGQPIKLARGAHAVIPTGLVIELPKGYEAQVRPRSGLALRHGVTVLNSPGTIDSDYRGEVKVILINLGNAPFRVMRGDRIAQLVIQPVARATLVAIKARKARKTQRGEGGFGSTGTASPGSGARIGRPAKRRRPKPKTAALRTRAAAKRTAIGRPTRRR